MFLQRKLFRYPLSIGWLIYVKYDQDHIVD